jgi:hypothetical protein
MSKRLPANITKKIIKHGQKIIMIIIFQYESKRTNGGGTVEMERKRTIIGRNFGKIDQEASSPR